MKFSLVIPTLWKSDRIFSILEQTIKCDNIGEIILISNSALDSKVNPYLSSSKVKVIEPKSNLFVNPSWNLGVERSTCDNIIISNDDIELNWEFYTQLLTSVDLDKVGFVGMSSVNYEITEPLDSIELQPYKKGEFGWGCLYAFDKKYWQPIPDYLKIWCGDSFIIEENLAPTYTLKGLPIKTEMSTTSDLNEFDLVKQQDKTQWAKYRVLKEYEENKHIFLPLSIGILAWNSGQTLVDTLTTYYKNGLLRISNNITIFYQEFSETDRQIADHFHVGYVACSKNVGIGQAFLHLAHNAFYDNILLLEHDWHLTEDYKTTYSRLKSGIELLNNVDVVKYRHRNNPGYPLFSRSAYEGNELNHYDEEMDAVSPHLLESIHWCDPHKKFPDKISKNGEYFITDSKWGNWTNNPALYKKEFYLKTVSKFAGNGIDLEGNIAKWWNRSNFTVAHGEGLFTHKDINKFGK